MSQAVAIDSSPVVEARRAALRERVASLVTQGVNVCLAAVSVGDDPAWRAYQRGQAKGCQALGIEHRPVVLPEGSSQGDLDETIERLNLDSSVHGVIIQAPLPKGLDQDRVQALLSPTKDVEGVNPANLGLVLSGRPQVAPCTAQAAAALAAHHLGDLRGVEAVVVGASTIVGKPLAQLLLAAGATVRVCHIDTRNLALHTRQAELVCVAVGRPGLITAEMLAPGATVIDVGINRIKGPDGKGKTVGDVAEDAWSVAGAITPVPGGVGTLTSTVLLEQTVAAAERLAQQQPAMDATAVHRLLDGAGLELPPAAAARVADLLGSHLVAGSIDRATPAMVRHLERQVLVLDGGVSSELEARGIAPDATAQANIDAPQTVTAVHQAYLDAGAEAITANTFAINRYCLGGDRGRAVSLAQAGVRLARQAAAGRAFVLGSIGPLGPLVGGEISLAEAEDAFAEIAMALADAGVDAIACETMPSTAEAMAAVRASRRVSGLPVLVSRAYDRLDHVELRAYAQAAEAAGAAAVGLNCVSGPRALVPALACLSAASALPVLARPNAGHPQRDGDRLIYQLRPEWLVTQAEAYLAAGVRLVGGCCGVGPDHIAELHAAIAGRAITPIPTTTAAVDPAVEPRTISHPWLDSLHQPDQFSVMALAPGLLSPADGRHMATALASAGVQAVGLLSGWPGAIPAARMPARLRHISDHAQVPAVFELAPGVVDLGSAQEVMVTGHLLGHRILLIDAGISARDGAAVDPIRLVQLAAHVNQGRDVTGGYLDEATEWVIGVRLPIDQLDQLERWRDAGADFATIQPVYEPARFRAAMAAVSGDLPLLAEVLVLPDARTAEEIDNEIPTVSVPARLRQRLAEHPDEDIEGVLRFLSHWRSRLAGACLILPDERTAAPMQVMAGLQALRD